MKQAGEHKSNGGVADQELLPDALTEAKKVIEADQKRRKNGFEKELEELKKKWGVRQVVAHGDTTIDNIVKALNNSNLKLITIAS